MAVPMHAQKGMEPTGGVVEGTIRAKEDTSCQHNAGSHPYGLHGSNNGEAQHTHVGGIQIPIHARKA